MGFSQPCIHVLDLRANHLICTSFEGVNVTMNGFQNHQQCTLHTSLKWNMYLGIQIYKWNQHFYANIHLMRLNVLQLTEPIFSCMNGFVLQSLVHLHFTNMQLAGVVCI